MRKLGEAEQAVDTLQLIEPIIETILLLAWLHVFV